MIRATMRSFPPSSVPLLLLLAACAGGSPNGKDQGDDTGSADIDADTIPDLVLTCDECRGSSVGGSEWLVYRGSCTP